MTVRLLPVGPSRCAAEVLADAAQHVQQCIVIGWSGEDLHIDSNLDAANALWLLEQAKMWILTED